MVYNLYVSGSATGQTTLSVTFGGFNETVTNRTMTLSGPGTITGTTSILLRANSSASNTVSVSGLSPSTSYTYTVTCNGESASGTFTTQAPPSYPPSWSDNALSSTVTAGVAYSDGVSANNMQYGGTYSISSGALPSGVTLDSATGAVTGTPTVVGNYSFTITASNSYGSISQSFSWTVNGGLYTYKSSVWNSSAVWKYDGSSWVIGTVYKYDGTNWVAASY